MHFFSMGPPERSTFEEQKPNTWSEPPASQFLVRGPLYLQQNKKNALEFKQPSVESPYRCIGLNVFVSPVPLLHTSVQIGEFRRYLENTKDEDGEGGVLPLHIVVCFVFRSFFASESTVVQHVFQRIGPAHGQDEVLERTMQRFLQGDDSYRNERFKFMLHVEKGPTAMLRTVRGLGGERPVLIGKRLNTKYFVGKTYLEVNMDVSSSRVASALNSTINRASKSSILDYCWLIEAENDDELPERVLVKLRSHFCHPPSLFIRLNANGERV